MSIDKISGAGPVGEPFKPAESTKHIPKGRVEPKPLLVTEIDEEFDKLSEAVKQFGKAIHGPASTLMSGLDQRSKLVAILVANGTLPEFNKRAIGPNFSESTEKMMETPADFAEKIGEVFHLNEGISEFVEHLEFPFPGNRAAEFIGDLFKIAGLSGDVLTIYIEQRMISDAVELRDALAEALKGSLDPNKRAQLEKQKENLDKWIKQKDNEMNHRWLELGYKGTVRVMSASHNAIRFLMDFAPTQHLEHTLMPIASSLHIAGASVGVISSGYQIYKIHKLGQSYEEWGKALEGSVLPQTISVESKGIDYDANKEKVFKHIEKQKEIEIQHREKNREAFETSLKKVFGDEGPEAHKKNLEENFEKNVLNIFNDVRKKEWSREEIRKAGTDEREFFEKFVNTRANELEEVAGLPLKKALEEFLKTGKPNDQIKSILNEDLTNQFRFFLLQKRLSRIGVDLVAHLAKIKNKDPNVIRYSNPTDFFPLKNSNEEFKKIVHLDDLKKASLESYLMSKPIADLKDNGVYFNLDTINELLGKDEIKSVNDFFKPEIREVMLKYHSGEKMAIGNRVKNGLRSLGKMKKETEYKFLKWAKIKYAIGFVLAVAGLAIAIGTAVAFPPSILIWVSIGLGVAGIALFAAGHLYDRYHKPNLTSAISSWSTLKAPFNEFRKAWHMWSLESKKMEKEHRERMYLFQSIRLREAEEKLKNANKEELQNLNVIFNLEDKSSDELSTFIQKEKERIEEQRKNDNLKFDDEIYEIRKKYEEAAEDVEKYRDTIRDAAWLDFKRELKDRGLSQLEENYENLFALNVLNILQEGKMNKTDLRYLDDHLGIDLSDIEDRDFEIGRLIKDTLASDIEQLKEVFQKSQVAAIL